MEEASGRAGGADADKGRSGYSLMACARHDGDAVMMTSAAIIISWNLWQMDGLKGQTPDGRECLIRDWEAGECVRWSEVLGRG